MGVTSELRAWRLLRVLQHSAEGGAQLSTSLPLTHGEARAGQAPKEEAVSLALCPRCCSSARRGWTSRGGHPAGIIRDGQGTSAMSSQLGLAPGRRQQALPALLVQPSTLPQLWFPHRPPGAPSLWPCFWPCMKVSCPPSFVAARGSIHWYLLQGYGASQCQLGA